MPTLLGSPIAATSQLIQLIDFHEDQVQEKSKEELEELLNNTSTPEAILDPLLDLYQQSWDNPLVPQGAKIEIVEILFEHILIHSHEMHHEIAFGGQINKKSSWATDSTFITSRSGLKFLSFVNDQIVASGIVLETDEDGRVEYRLK